MDDIQRKLAQIDRKLAGGRNLHKHIVSTSPLVFTAVGLMAGIVIQDTFAWSIHLWLTLLVVCVIGTFITLGVPKAADRPYVTAYMASICFMCLGAIRLSNFYQPEPEDIRNFVASERKLATIRGLIVTEPYINANQQWQFAKFTFGDPSTSFYLKVKQIQTVTGWIETSGTIQVHVAEPLLDLKAGDYIQAYCWLDRFKKTSNPGQFDIAEYMSRRNVFITASIESRDSITLLKNESVSCFAGLKSKVEERAMQALLGDTLPDSSSQGLLQALLLGYRKNIDNATYEAFRKTGLLHLICLSGMNFAILIGIVWWLCGIAGLMKPARAVICMIASGFFLLSVPPSAPTIRAAIMSFAFCISFLFRRQTNSLNTLSLAAIALLLIRPTQVFEAGWQLSFAATLGIILLSRRIENFLYEKITNNRFLEPIANSFSRQSANIGLYVLKALCVSLAAWAGAAGILLYHFYTITPLGAIWTAVVSPIVSLILIVGFLKIILFFLIPTVSSAFEAIITLMSDWLIYIVKLMARLDFSSMLIGHTPLPVIILYYCFILFTAFAYLRHPFLKKAISVGMAVVMVAPLGVTKWQRIYRDDLILNCLDVGQGQAILMQLPGRANILFDAGSLHKDNIGQRIVVPFLDYRGINKIDAIIISHDDVDHINGIPEIVEHCDVNGVYANDAFFSAAKADPNDTAAFLSNVLRKKKKDFEIKNIKDLNLNSSAKIKILWPSEETCCNNELSDNDKSVVLLIEFADRKILLCSDIEKFAQKKLLLLFPNLKADLVVVPHHGSAASTAENFLKSLNADTLICSCGQSQFERIKSETKTLTIKSENTKSFYTASDGLVTVCIDKNGKIKTTTFIKGNSLQ